MQLLCINNSSFPIDSDCIDVLFVGLYNNVYPIARGVNLNKFKVALVRSYIGYGETVVVGTSLIKYRCQRYCKSLWLYVTVDMYLIRPH